MKMGKIARDERTTHASTGRGSQPSASRFAMLLACAFLLGVCIAVTVGCSGSNSQPSGSSASEQQSQVEESSPAAEPSSAEQQSPAAEPSSAEQQSPAAEPSSAEQQSPAAEPSSAEQQSPAAEPSSAEQQPMVPITGEGLDEDSTPAPVQITGVSDDGKQVDVKGFVDYAGSGLTLPRGTYKLSFTTSPIGSDGQLYMCGGIWELVIGSDGATAKKDDSDAEQAEIILEPIDIQSATQKLIEDARQSAIEAGIAPERVNELLQSAEDSVINTQGSRAFTSAQKYRGTLYVGNVSTAEGDVPMTAIPGSTALPVDARRILCVDGFCFYIESPSGQQPVPADVTLHRYDLATGDDAVLSSDVMPGTNLYFDSGKIVFLTQSGAGATLGVVDVQTGESSEIDLGTPRGITRLLGASRGAAYLLSTAFDDACVASFDLESGEASEVMPLDSGDTPLAMMGERLLVSRGNRILMYDLNGEVTDSACKDEISLAGFDPSWNGFLYFITQPELGAPKDIVRIDSGALVDTFPTGVPHIAQVAYADDEAVYFCGGDSAEAISSGDEPLKTYACYFEDGRVVCLDDGAEIPTGESHDADRYRVGEVIETADFSIGLPEYWQGKVEWVEEKNEYGLTCVNVFPLGMDRRDERDKFRCRLATIEAKPLGSPVTGGDIGNAFVALFESEDKLVDVWITNWGYSAAVYNDAPDSPIVADYTAEELSTLVDLSTAGQLSFDECTVEYDKTAYNYLKRFFESALHME